MKKFIVASLFSVATFAGTELSAQNTTVILHVQGSCEMCKKRIETAVDVKGVKAADYNLEKKELELTYNPQKVDLAFLKQEILKIGYDVDSLKAPEEAYKKLDHCCQYDRNHNHGSHD